jgi:predicted O-linked N-acetylglucosamine transferase (SPINDLY family)
MNIFYLDRDPVICAQYHCNKHVVKMILETAQVLSAAHRLVDGIGDEDEVLYKLTHKNHPSTVWARENESNYNWLYRLFLELCVEYTYRYDKTHATYTRLNHILKIAPNNISKNKMFFAPPQCMPDEYKSMDTVKSYRAYYVGDKARMLQYKDRPIPSWIELIS